MRTTYDVRLQRVYGRHPGATGGKRALVDTLFGARDEERNEAVVLRSLIEERPAARS